MQGRPTSEVTEIGYTAWPVTAAATITNTFQGITFTLTRAGSNGTGLKSDWQKLAVDTPNYARLVGDGVTVDGGDAGGQIQMTIHGLSAGPHSLLAYLNQTANVASVAPVDILVNGTVKAMSVAPSIQAADERGRPDRVPDVRRPGQPGRRHPVSRAHVVERRRTRT